MMAHLEIIFDDSDDFRMVLMTFTGFNFNHYFYILLYLSRTRSIKFIVAAKLISMESKV